MAQDSKPVGYLTQLYYGAERPAKVVRGRLAYAGLALFLVFIIGTGGYWLIGNRQWSIEDCAYMVLITITTVGYAEVLPVDSTLQGRAFTMILLVIGMGVSLYFLSALTAFIIEGDLKEALWRRRMQRRLDKLTGHVIVCGVGRTGRYVVEELVGAGRTLVLIERAEKALDQMINRYGDGIIALNGDATEEQILQHAEVERADGLVTTLEHDRDNLYVALSARQLNPELRIVSRGDDERARGKLRQAGADVIINPATIGGRRMAHELLRPNVVGFLDVVGREGAAMRNLCIEEIVIPPGSPLVGRTLATSTIRQVSNALVLGVLDPNEDQPTYNPPPDFAFEAGMTVIVLGEREASQRLNLFVKGDVTPSMRPPPR